MNRNNTNEPARVLFLGNGVNLVADRNKAYAWSEALNRLEEALVPAQFRSVPWDAPDNDLSYGLRLQRILNFKDMSITASDAWSEWLKEVRNLQPTFVHRLLASLTNKGDFSEIMTTNYDFAIERAFVSKFNEPKDETNCILLHPEAKDAAINELKVWHLHGHAAQSENVVMSMDSYRKAIHKHMAAEGSIQTSEELGWMDSFCNKEVHVCGFSFHPEELLIWYALEQRFNQLIHKPHFEELHNRFFIYLFYTPSNEQKQRRLAEILKSYATQPILIPVPTNSCGNPDYSAAWLQIFARMQMMFTKIRFTNEESEIMGTQRHAFLESRNKNLATAYTTSYKYPHLCKMAIPDKKRLKADLWCFYCEIERVSYMWTVPVASIMAGIAKQDGSASRNNSGYDFYLDYSKGILYSCHQNSTLPTHLYIVCSLNREYSLKAFEAAFIHISSEQQ